MASLVLGMGWASHTLLSLCPSAADITKGLPKQKQKLKYDNDGTQIVNKQND